MRPHRLQRIIAHLRAVVREWNGEAPYERYLRRCADSGAPPLDRGRYLAQRLEEQYRTTSRCC